VFNKLGGLLDLVFTNNKNISVIQATSPLVKEDEYLPTLWSSIHIPSAPKPRGRTSYRDFNKADYNFISSFFLLSFSFLSRVETFSRHSVNKAAVLFNDALLSCIDKFVPLVHHFSIHFLLGYLNLLKIWSLPKNVPTLNLINLCYVQTTLFCLNSEPTINVVSWTTIRILVVFKKYFLVHPSTFGNICAILRNALPSPP